MTSGQAEWIVQLHAPCSQVLWQWHNLTGCTLGASDWKGEGVGADCGMEKGSAAPVEEAGAGVGAMWPWFSDWARARVLCVGHIAGWCAPASRATASYEHI